MQTILWGQPVGEAGVLPNPCGGDALCEFEVYLTGLDTLSGSAFEGFLDIQKKKKKKILEMYRYFSFCIFFFLFEGHPFIYFLCVWVVPPFRCFLLGRNKKWLIAT